MDPSICRTIEFALLMKMGVNAYAYCAFDVHDIMFFNAHTLIIVDVLFHCCSQPNKDMNGMRDTLGDLSLLYVLD